MEPQQSPANPLAAARREKPKQGNKAVAKPKHAGSKNAGTKRHPLNRRPEELGAKRRASKGDGPDLAGGMAVARLLVGSSFEARAQERVSASG